MSGMNQNNSAWTPELKDQVKTLWADHSAAEIATVMNGQGYTFTRNAIVGALHRLGLTHNNKEKTHPNTSGKNGGAGRPQRSLRPVRTRAFTPRIAYELPETIQLRCVEIVPRGLTVLDLEPNDCRWPYGDDAITFCGHPKMAGSPYCVPHMALGRGLGTRSEQMARRGIAS